VRFQLLDDGLLLTSDFRFFFIDKLRQLGNISNSSFDVSLRFVDFTFSLLSNFCNGTDGMTFMLSALG
jgi:hypothetical protein